MGAALSKKAFTPHGPVGTAVSANVITRKADAKLNYVSDIFTKVLGDRAEDCSRRFLDKTIDLRGFKFIDFLNMRYRMDNRFFAIIYDLFFETSVTPRQKKRPAGAMRFEADLKGKMFVTDAAFTMRDCAEGEEAYADEILSLLNNELIRDRILLTDLADITISFDPASGKWTIRCRSIIGSTTWNLIPPLTQLIKPKDDECVRLLEFFELTASCLV
jgi:hypothetical protein